MANKATARAPTLLTPAPGSAHLFNLDTFVADCVAAAATDDTHLPAHELMKRAFADPAAVLAAVGEPKQGGLYPIYQSPALTILSVVWRSGMAIQPHNHETWSVIGVYTGREDNIFWRRIKDHPDGRIEAAGARALATGDVVPLGRDIIHSVTNPIPRLTGALHIYGGAFFDIERSEWDPEHLTEHPYDIAKAKALFSR